MNTEKILAIESDGCVSAVYHEAAKRKVAAGKVIEVVGSHLLKITHDSLIVTDPTHNLQWLAIKRNAKKYTLHLQGGDVRGRQV